MCKKYLQEVGKVYDLCRAINLPQVVGKRKLAISVHFVPQSGGELELYKYSFCVFQQFSFKVEF